VSMKTENVRLILAVQPATFPRSPIFSAVTASKIQCQVDYH